MIFDSLLNNFSTLEKISKTILNIPKTIEICSMIFFSFCDLFLDVKNPWKSSRVKKGHKKRLDFIQSIKCSAEIVQRIVCTFVVSYGMFVFNLST